MNEEIKFEQKGEEKPQPLYKRLWFWVCISVLVLIIISIWPKSETVCYEYKVDGGETDSEASSELAYDSLENDDDTEYVCHYANTRHYNSYFWYSHYNIGGTSYTQGKQVNPGDAEKYGNVKSLESVDSSADEKTGSKTSSKSAAKSSSSGSKSTGSKAGGHSTGHSSGGHASS